MAKFLYAYPFLLCLIKCLPIWLLLEHAGLTCLLICGLFTLVIATALVLFLTNCVVSFFLLLLGLRPQRRILYLID